MADDFKGLVPQPMAEVIQDFELDQIYVNDFAGVLISEGFVEESEFGSVFAQEASDWIPHDLSLKLCVMGLVGNAAARVFELSDESG